MKKLLLIPALFSTSLLAQTNQLTLYFIPSPYRMDWSSPANLAWTALKNKLSFKSHFMGHVFVELECGKNKDVTGMVGKKFDYLNQLLVEGRGLGILYHSFEGGLENKDDVVKEISELTETGERINFVRYRLNEGQCNRAQKYLTEYRAQNVGRYYGLANRPLHGEGAGCSAFGASFMEVTGLINVDIKDAWTGAVNIPMSFAGPPLKEEKVNLLKLMFNAQSWATANEPHKTLTYWDPDKMYDWVTKKISEAPQSKEFKVVAMSKARGIEVDKSYLPAPSGPIWKPQRDPTLTTKKK